MDKEAKKTPIKWWVSKPEPKLALQEKALVTEFTRKGQKRREKKIEPEEKQNTEKIEKKS